jgi:hypothetical protein
VEVAVAVAFGLLQSVFRRQAFAFRFQNGRWHRFCVWSEWTAKNVIGASFGPALSLVMHDVHCRQRFLDLDIAAFPSSCE